LILEHNIYYLARDFNLLSINW